MKNTYTILKSFFQATQIPIYYYHHGLLADCFLATEDVIVPTQNQLNSLLVSEKTIDYVATDFFAYFGQIILDEEKKEFIIVGPILQMPLTEDSYSKAEKAYVIAEKDKEQFLSFAHSLPLMPVNQFINSLRSIYFFLTGQELSSHEILKEHDHIYQAKPSVIKTFENKENNYYNNSYAIEQLLSSYIENGQLEKLSQFIEQPFQVHEGKVAYDQLRQIKNTAIVSITFATRAAIRGGMDTETAFQISDSSIRQVEQLNSFETIQHLMQEVLFELTKRVQEVKSSHTSQEFLPLVHYIQKNINQPLTVSLLAEKFGYSRGYLSSRFKKVNHCSLQEFIRDCKIKEAKQLLAYTDKPISLISNYLCFSSQSHFQTVFKKQTNQSPLHYRKQMKQNANLYS